MRTTIDTYPVGNELARFCRLRDQLLGEIPDIDAETLADTLEGITDLRDMLAEVIRSALDDEALIAALSTRIDDMKARLDRFESTPRASGSSSCRR